MTKDPLPPRKDIPSYWRDQSDDTAWLHLGENPFQPTPHVLKAIWKAAESSNRYPDTNALELRRKLAEYVGNGLTEKNIIIGNGSDDLIDLVIVTFTTPADMVATFEPSFFVYHFASQRHRVSVLPIPRDTSFNLPDSLNLIQKQQPIGLSFIDNPNNPTGVITARTHLLEFINTLPGIVVVDECYYEFSGETLVDQVFENKRLIIFRSLSKSFGLSGLRLGYAVAHEELIEQMARYALTFPVNALAQAAGIAALEDVRSYRERIQNIIQWRNELSHQLENAGVQVLPSHTNFILALFPPSTRNPAQFLAQHNILVSDQTTAIGKGVPAIRIAVGQPEENVKVLETVKQYLQEEKSLT